MFKKYTYFLMLSSMLLLTVSCHNDVGDINPQSEQSNIISQPPFNVEEIDGDLVGFIYDAANNPIEGVEVTIYSSETTTDEFGMFFFNQVKLDPQGTYIRAEKDGFMSGSDFVYPNTNGKGTSRILLLEVINNPVFDAEVGGVIEIPGGGSISFPSFSLIRPSGSIYDGDVRATVYKISPQDQEIGSKMAGGLLGVDEKGRHQVLSTFGMLAIELRSFDNQKLQMKSDKLAELVLPIESNLQALVTDEEKSWHFNVEEGVWREKAKATNDQQNFYTSLDALGFWNIGIPNDVSQVCGRLIYTNELPAKNYVIQVENNGLLSRIGLTDQDGYFCGKLPKGESLKLQVLHPLCGEVLKEQIIGEFDEIGTIGDIILAVDEKYLQGQVSCKGEGVSDAIIVTTNEGEINFFYPNENGSFAINAEEIVCGSSSEFTVFAYHLESGSASEVTTLNSNNLEPLNLEVCQSECLAAGAFEYHKEDYCENGLYNRVVIEVSHGSGEYLYEWQDGSTQISLNDPPLGEICVKVTDIVTECVYEFCDEVKVYKRLDISSIYSSNNECLASSGFVELTVDGGRGQLEYEWTGPDGFTSNDQSIEGLVPGTYEVLVKDSENCEISESIDVYNITTPIELLKEDFCAVTIITIEDMEGYKPFTYTWNESDADVIGNQLFVYSPGVYNVTMTDANDCTRSTSLGINTVGFLPEIDSNYDCEDGVVIFSNANEEHDYFYQTFGTGNMIPLEVIDGRIEVEILEAGYGFELSANNPNYSDCSVSEEITLPKFEGLVIEDVANTSCETCADGFIAYEINVEEDCNDCVPGEVIVVEAESGSDVTDLNDGQSLEKGEYYVIVLDEGSGCYIAHASVILE